MVVVLLSVLVTDPGSDVPANGAGVIVKSQNTNYRGEVLIYNVTNATPSGDANNVLNIDRHYSSNLEQKFK